jgi:hypothetical protein
VQNEVTFKYITPLLIDLTETLIHFNKAYGFSHRDLHMGNVMFNSRKAALLDFGMSCITYRSVTYGDPIRFSGRCWTFDMYTFLASLLTGSGRPRIPGGKMTNDCYGTIRNMFTFGDKNLYTEAVKLVESDKIRPPVRLPAHVFYPDRFKKYNIAPTLALVSMTHLLDIQSKILAPSYPDDQQILDARIERTRLETRNWSLIAAADARAADLAADVLKFDRSELYIKNAKKTAENARESRERKADAEARYNAAVATAARFRKTAAASLRRRGPSVASSAPAGKKADPSCCSWRNGIWSCFCRRKRGGSRKTKYRKGCGSRATRRRR